MKNWRSISMILAAITLLGLMEAKRVKDQPEFAVCGDQLGSLCVSATKWAYDLDRYSGEPSLSQSNKLNPPDLLIFPAAGISLFP